MVRAWRRPAVRGVAWGLSEEAQGDGLKWEGFLSHGHWTGLDLVHTAIARAGPTRTFWFRPN